MATIYVSYKSEELQFVQAVMAPLEGRHDIRVDYLLPAGVDWQAEQLQDLRRCDVFLVFVSHQTSGSDFQNAEMGSARFCKTFLDDKLVIPVLIDDVRPPRPLAHLDALDLRDRDSVRATSVIEAVLQRRKPRVRLFISHAHLDADIAAGLVDVLTSNLAVPDGELRCTSVPGYKLDLGAMAGEQLRRELGSAVGVLALVTPNSLSNDWVLFELGACWAHASLAIPLLAGGLQDRDIPGPFRGTAGGQLDSQPTIDHLIDQLGTAMGWPRHDAPGSRSKRYQFVADMQAKTFPRDALEEESRATFTAKRLRIGPTQGALLDQIVDKLAGQPHVPQQELAQASGEQEATLFYRLEQLRLYGFLERVPIGQSSRRPLYGWRLADRFRREMGL